jgi:hypothetical protein
LLVALAAVMAGDPKRRWERRWRVFQERALTLAVPRWIRRSGRNGPFNREQEAERRRRQIVAGILKV